MKANFIMLAIALIGVLTISHASEEAADKPKIAVYVVSDTLADNEKEAFEGLISTRFEKDKRYRYIQRSNPILAGLNMEMEKQRGGEVDVAQISERGKQYGVPLVCVVRVWHAFNRFNIKASLIVTETAEGIDGAIKDMEEMNDYDKVKQIADEIYNEIVPAAKADEPAVVYVEKPAEAKPYEDFTKAERIGTFVLNHALGMGSYFMMDNGLGAGLILGLEVAGGLLYYFSSTVKMPDRNDYDEYGSKINCNVDESYSCKYAGDRDHALERKYLILVPGLIMLGCAEIINLVTSFSYEKPQPTASLASPRNFSLAVLPTRNGNGVAYGVAYSRGF